MRIEPLTLVSEGDNAAFAYTLTGTHRGDFLGIPATGKTVEVRGMQIGCFENGKRVECWGSWDELGLLTKIDALPV